MTMLLTYHGMQQKNPGENNYAQFILCAGHFLNLVGRAAVDCCLAAVNFVATLQRIYTFFSASIHRWAVIVSFVDGNYSIPKLSGYSRREAHSNTTSAIMEGYDEIVEALDAFV